MPFSTPFRFTPGSARGLPLLKAATAEFLGVALWMLLSATTEDALGAAFAFGAIQYGVKFVSGGHLNPAVSLAAAASGHIRWSTGAVYATSQFLGALLGALLQASLIPASHVGKPSAGCIAPNADVNGGELLGWEFLMTFTFILVQYASLFLRPGHGVAAPLASATTLYAILSSGGAFTGGSPVNPARSLASTVVFSCYWEWVWVYLFAQVLAMAAGALYAVSFHGRGMYYGGASGAQPLTGGEDTGYTELGGREGAAASALEPAGAADLEGTFMPTGRGNA